MSTAEELLMESQMLMFDAVLGKPESRDDNRPQAQARADYIAALDDDKCADMICEIARDNWSEIAEAIAKDDAIELQRIFEKSIDKDVP